MLPITVDLARIRVVLVGAGRPLRCRFDALLDAGAQDLELYAPAADAGLAAAAGRRLRRRLPEPAEITRAQLVFIAGLPAATAAPLRHIARGAGILTNVEDEPEACDFHSPSVLRRGDLTIAVSTNGQSPGLAALVRRRLENQFGPEWSDRLAELAALRQGWRAAGAAAPLVKRWTAQLARTRGWLDEARG
jgi:precorrin-2 dehydrogenase/sirohydrochlorin ferrochelatase